jgi:hypothetical protein
MRETEAQVEARVQALCALIEHAVDITARLTHALEIVQHPGFAAAGMLDMSQERERTLGGIFLVARVAVFGASIEEIDRAAERVRMCQDEIEHEERKAYQRRYAGSHHRPDDPTRLSLERAQYFEIWDRMFRSVITRHPGIKPEPLADRTARPPLEEGV